MFPSAEIELLKVSTCKQQLYKYRNKAIFLSGVRWNKSELLRGREEDGDTLCSGIFEY